MSWQEDQTIRTFSPEVAADRRIVEEFLNLQGLDYEDDIEYSVGLYRGNELSAVGSLAGRIIKGVAVLPRYRGENLTGKVLSYLKLKAHHRGVHSLFVYTTPENREFFTTLGYTLIGETAEVALLEDSKRNIRLYREHLEGLNPRKLSAASLVMNCNPFTLGHRYLVEEAAGENPMVYLFVVQEDRSVFPFDVRFRLVQEGVADLGNVRVVPGGDYIISNATFPSYFIKDKGAISSIHTDLDLSIFGATIAPSAGIVRRYVGHEPFCPVTKSYNSAMQRILPQYGLEVKELKRKEADSIPISASEVRKRISCNQLDQLADLVPTATYAYLASDEAAPIREKLQGVER